MATSKLLKPTNVTISIPAFTDQPDQRVNSNCIDKEADAINSLSDQIANYKFTQVDSQDGKQSLYYCKIGKMVFAKFYIRVESLAKSTLSIAVPSGYRPKEIISIPCSALNSNTGVPVNGMLLVNSNGQILYQGQTMPASVEVSWPVAYGFWETD